MTHTLGSTLLTTEHVANVFNIYGFRLPLLKRIGRQAKVTLALFE